MPAVLSYHEFLFTTGKKQPACTKGPQKTCSCEDLQAYCAYEYSEIQKETSS